jgi:hypothetical protein
MQKLVVLTVTTLIAFSAVMMIRSPTALAPAAAAPQTTGMSPADQPTSVTRDRPNDGAERPGQPDVSVFLIGHRE